MPRAARGAARRLAGRSRSTSSSPTRSGTRSPTARTRSTATATTATRCCRASRSSPTRTRTSRRTRSRAAGLLHCEIRLGRGRPDAALHQRPPRALRARAAVADRRAVRAHPRPRCPRTRRWSSPATSTTGGTRRTGCWSTSSGVDEVFEAVRGRPARTFPVGAAGVPPRPHLRARPRHRRRARPLRVSTGAAVRPRGAGRDASRPPKRAR